jgi:hypothetical protein
MAREGIFPHEIFGGEAMLNAMKTMTKDSAKKVRSTSAPRKQSGSASAQATRQAERGQPLEAKNSGSRSPKQENL